MRYLIITACLVIVCSAVLAASLWQRRQSSELSPMEYGSLYALRRMEPEFFKEKLLPELEKALADGRLTHGELRAIEAKVGSVGAMFMKAIKERSFDEELGASLREAEKKARETGRSLGDTLGKAFNDAMEYMLRKSEELSRQIPPAPQPGVEPPAKF